jgi:hypothetical protein
VVNPKRKKKAPAAGNKTARPLLYKVVELSTVDEAALERTVNEWVPHGWKFDGVQFAMRESSKRPSMAFVFFTREGHPRPVAVDDEPTLSERGRSLDAAEMQLRRLADDGASVPAPVSAWERLAQLAGEDES